MNIFRVFMSLSVIFTMAFAAPTLTMAQDDEEYEEEYEDDEGGSTSVATTAPTARSGGIQWVPKVGIIGGFGNGLNINSTTLTGRTAPFVGVSGWFGPIGLDITGSYQGKDDQSRTDLKGTGVTQSSVTASGANDPTVTLISDGGSDVYDIVNGSQSSFTIMPKYSILQRKNSYFFVGVPVTVISKYTNKSNSVKTTKTWSNAGTTSGSAADLADDFLASETVVTDTDETTYKSRTLFGIYVGGAFQFESIQGLELIFGIGFRMGTAAENSRTLTQSTTVTTLTSATDTDSVVTTTADTLSSGTTARRDGTQGKDSSGLGTFGGEALAEVRIAYYFL